ncbi:MAG TPA: PEP-CTERM sorting domain-containing protein [Tepidisphaeraceae bacterium]
MKKSTLALAVLSSAAMATSASASLLIYEPFDYQASSLIVPGSVSTNSGNGLSDSYDSPATVWQQDGAYASGTNEHHITSTGLTSPSGFPASIGNAAALEGGASAVSDYKEMARMNLPGATGSQATDTYVPGSNPPSLFYSLLINVPATTGMTTAHSNANANNDMIMAFNNAIGATSSESNTWADELTIRLGSVANTYNLGIRASTTAANTTYWSGDLTPGSTYLVATEWTEGTTAGTGGLSQIWVNPSSTTFGAGSAPTADGSTVGTYSATALNDHTDSIIIGAGVATNSNPNEVDIDEIRVGTTWADVTTVPEPASLSLLGLGAIAAMKRRRARIQI